MVYALYKKYELAKKCLRVLAKVYFDDSISLV